MRPASNLRKLIVLTLLLGLVFSCAAPPQVKPPEVSFYVTPAVTYLLDKPEYGANVMGPLYRGDKVERQDSGESPWWQVKLLRSGQTGWIRKELLSSDAISSAFYYVKEDMLPLLECPRHDCLPLQVLYRGDQVQRVEEGAQDWWRILAIKSRSLGWVPASSLAERLEEIKPTQAPYYYVAVKNLSLRAQPSNRGAVIRTLRFNDQVQKMGETEGWVKVRQPATGALGWVRSRDLEGLPLISPRGLPAKEEPKPFIPKEEPQVEPEFM